MASREKDQADFDLETFVDLFDTAMSSDNPAVQRALKNLLMIAAIVNAEDKNEAIVKGPLRRMVEDQKNIIRRLQDVEAGNSWNKTYGPITPGTPGAPTTPFGPVTTWPTTPLGPVPLGPYTGPATTWPTPGTGMPPNQIWCATSTSGPVAIAGKGFGTTNSSYDDLLDKLETRN